MQVLLSLITTLLSFQGKFSHHAAPAAHKGNCPTRYSGEMWLDRGCINISTELHLAFLPPEMRTRFNVI